MKLLAIPMKPITAYSFLHIVIVIGIILASILIAQCLKNIKASTNYVVCICAIMLILLEILKQFLLTYVRGGNYAWSGFPFQLCSTPMYLCILYLLIPKLRPAIADFIMVYGFIGAMASFLVPYSTLTGYLLLTIQSFLWHGIIFFLSIFFLLQRDCNSLFNFRAVSYIYIVLSLIAIFINISFYRISVGTINMFFLGPGYPNVFILNTIYEKTYWEIEALIMIFVSLLTGFIVYRIMTFISSLQKMD